VITVNVHVGSEFYFIRVSAKFTYYGVHSDRQLLGFISFTCSFTFAGHFAVAVRNLCWCHFLWFSTEPHMGYRKKENMMSSTI